MDAVMAVELAKLATDLIAKLILAGKRQEAEAVRAILGRAGINFTDLVEWSERP